MFSKILIVKWGALGDILASTSALSMLREKHPNAQIYWLTSGVTKDLIVEGREVKKLIIRSDLNKMGVWKSIKYLRRLEFDLVINLKWGSESADLISLLSGSKVKVSGSKNKFLRRLYDFSPQGHYDEPNRHEYLKNIDIVESLGFVHKHVKTFLNITEKSKKVSSAFLESKGLSSSKYILISPGASTLKKAWSKRKYIDLCKRIISNYSINMLFSFAPKDKDYCKDIVYAVGKNAFLCDDTSINELAYLVKKASFVICNNSGIMHVAYAVDTPVACFNTSIGWRPYGDKDISIERFPEEVSNNRDLSNKSVEQLLNKISVDEAYRDIQKLLPS